MNFHNAHMREEVWQHLQFYMPEIFEFKKVYINFSSAFMCSTMIIWIMEVPMGSAMNKIFMLVIV